MKERDAWKRRGLKTIGAVLRKHAFRGSHGRYVRILGEVAQAVIIQSLPKAPEGHWQFRLYDVANSEAIWSAFIGDLGYLYHPDCGPYYRDPLRLSESGIDYFDIDSEAKLEEALQITERVIEEYMMPTLDSLRTNDDVVEALKEHLNWSIASKEKLDEFFARWEERKKAQA